MFLKRLEIVGFKSFADRVTIEFDKGFTAVVGPNGSGKSNITDAIRWVLGEQSAKTLRGGKMEDIIFAGSDTRKPLNFAEVSLTLDNENHFLPLDYNEICITRRVYRSGESEFFINKQSCRLKDIIDLFMDSGLGKDGFSIISQGRVDEILNSKPEERRAIFEEAAGVLKYKKRKKKAEANLLETEENLNRVRDILHELENQLEPLKIQASVARNYLAKKEELEQYEVGLIVYEIENLHEQWEQAKMAVQEQRDLEIQLASQIAKKKADLTEIRERIAALDESIEELQQNLLETTELLEKLEGKKEVLKERKKNASANMETLKRTIAEDKKRLENLALEKAGLEAEYGKLANQLAEKRRLLEEKKRQLNTYSEDIQEKIESLKADFIEYMNNLATVKNESEHLDRQLTRIEQIRKESFQENQKYLDERKEIQKAKEELQQQYSEVEERLNQEIAGELDEKRKLENLQTQYAKEEQTYYKALQYIQQVKSRMDLLEEMEEEYSGFYQGVKIILKNRQRLSGIEGAVAELIEVDRPYEKAMETALASSMQHIVVRTEEDARRAIQFLKQNQAGRATFLPMNSIRGKQIPHVSLQAVSNHPSYIGVGTDLVSYDSQYANIISYLLGNVIISKDLEGANAIARLLQYRYRIVTLDGDVVNPGGSMTGGSVKKNSVSLLTRKNELEKLKKNYQGMQEKTVALEENLKAKKQAIQLAEQKIQEFEKKKNVLNGELQQLKDRLKDIEWQENSINEKLAIYDREEASYSEEIHTLKTKKVENEETKKRLEQQIAAIEQEIKDLSEKQNQDQTIKERLSEDINAVKISIAKLEEQFRHAETRLESIRERYHDVEETLKQNEEKLQDYEQTLNMSAEDELKLVEISEEKNQLKEKTLQLIADRRKNRLEYHQIQEDMEREAGELERQHKRVAEQLKETEVRMNRLDVELENRLQTLYTDYTLTYEGAKEKYELILPYEEAKKKVQLIKRSIEELGVVNLGAIDEYDRISERYQFLTGQKDDLETAKDQLYQVIDEMDEVMVERFGETFHAINHEFRAVFRSLFGGGQAELQLTNPDDLLNTGIEIIAQPPGKKLQTLGLLSGGERALTAIALLFSILRVRPVPFCVLDEVEAALDEANVYRFSQYLKEFSRETQFIVITHRKGTMEEADVLYGVTMQESGVSKLVSVRLEEAEENLQMKA